MTDGEVRHSTGWQAKHSGSSPGEWPARNVRDWVMLRSSEKEAASASGRDSPTAWKSLDPS